MASFSNKVRERLVAGIKRFQPILSSAKMWDIVETPIMVLGLNNVLQAWVQISTQIEGCYHS